MEDAMIINKSSDERGFAHGSVYKSEFVEVDTATSYFCRDPMNADLLNLLDTDGLPYLGKKMIMGDPLCCYYSTEECRYIVQRFMGKEECYVDTVRICGNLTATAKKLACITFRIIVSFFVYRE